MKEPEVLITKICVDGRFGAIYAIGTRRGWIEIRVTPKGFLRVGNWNKGKHPYCTPEGGKK